MKILPYVYKLTHKETGEFYIGVRYGNKHPAELDLGKRYFSSSKIVKPRFNEFNYEILREFNDSLSAIDYEKKSNRRKLEGSSNIKQGHSSK